jgi:hypothetical protein
MMGDAVNNPAHYNAGSIEVIDAIDAWGFGPGFCAGNAIKYIARHEHKGQPVEDLEKARWYLDHLIKLRRKEYENR